MSHRKNQEVRSHGHLITSIALVDWSNRLWMVQLMKMYQSLWRFYMIIVSEYGKEDCHFKLSRLGPVWCKILTHHFVQKRSTTSACMHACVWTSHRHWNINCCRMNINKITIALYFSGLNLIPTNLDVLWRLSPVPSFHCSCQLPCHLLSWTMD